MIRPTHRGLRHLALNVRDIGVMTRFYVELLGFTVDWQPDADNVYLTSGADNLALHRSGGAGVSPSPLDHFGLVVAEPDDVDRWAAFLKEQGVPLDAMPRTHRDGTRSCYLRDPEGNRIQIIHLNPKP